MKHYQATDNTIGTGGNYPSDLLGSQGVMDATDAQIQLRLRHQGARLLLAEDSAINREIVLELLRDTGIVVELAEDGLEAFEKVLTNTYDLILMDVQMPHMNGLEAVRAIRDLIAWETKPIVAFTANTFPEDRLACAEAGMNDFIAKPLNPVLLYSTLLKWLSVSGTA
ncbi:MAG: response regulator [Methylococcaceae bacterium]